MGRRKYSKKIEADDLRKITIFQFRKYLRSYDLQFGKNEWKDSYGQKHVISAFISITDNESYARLRYSRFFILSETIIFDRTVQLVTTPCHYGKYRYWFICPDCQKRIGVLYANGNYLACRHCQDLTYKSKNFGKKSRNYEFIQLATVPDKMIELTGNLRSRYYAGKPTRRFRKFIKFHDRNQRYVNLLLEEIKNNPQMFE